MNFFRFFFSSFCRSVGDVRSGFTEFHRVLPSLTGFYRVLLGFTEFYGSIQESPAPHHVGRSAKGQPPVGDHFYRVFFWFWYFFLCISAVFTEFRLFVTELFDPAHRFPHRVARYRVVPSFSSKMGRVYPVAPSFTIETLPILVFFIVKTR